MNNIVNKWKTSDWRSDLAAFAAGALLPFSLAPYNISVLGIIASTILALMLVKLNSKRGFIRAFIFGFGMYGFGASWVYRSIHDFGFTSTPLAIILTLLFVLGLAFVFALPFIIYCKFCNNTRPGFILGFTAIWVLGEWSRSWFLTGFPWLYVGYAHADTWLSGWAPLVGVFGLSFLAVLSGIVISDFFHQLINVLRSNSHPENLHVKSKIKSSVVHVSAIVALWLAGWGLGFHHWTQPADHPPLDVAIVQPNIAQPMKWNPYYFPFIKQTLRDLTRDHWDADLILWPENAVPNFFHEASEFLEEVHTRAELNGTALITGILYDDIQNHLWYNTIIGIGSANGKYFKQRLVPFGEYVPLEGYLRGLIEFFDLPNSMISIGPQQQEPLHTDTYSVSSFICYEIVYPDLVAHNSRESQLMLTISNDAWFGDSIGPVQHFQMAQMRALENGKYLLRSTNTGVSGIVSPKGEIIEVLTRQTQEVRRSEILLMEGATPFAKYKSWPIIVLCFLSLLIAYMRHKKKLISGNQDMTYLVKPPLLLLFLLISILVASCSSTKIAYNFLDWAFDWHLGKYINLNREQKVFSKKAIDDFHSWHRKTQLPIYHKYIKTLKPVLLSGSLTGEIIHNETDKVQALIDISIEELLPSLVDLASMLDDKQTERLQVNLKKERDDYKKKYIDISTGKQLKLRKKPLKKILKRLLGKLNKNQEDWLDNWAVNMIPYEEMTLLQQAHWAKAAAKAVEFRHDKTQLEEHVRGLMFYHSDNWEASAKKTLDKNQNLTYEFIARIFNNLTAKQRKHLEDALDGYMRDFALLTRSR